MDDLQFIRVERHPVGETGGERGWGGDVVVVVLDRPKVNALNADLLRELGQIAEACTVDPPGALVVTGGGRHFAAGAEISDFTQAVTRIPLAEAFLASFTALAAVPCPTIAAVNGFALGGGAELAMCCDFRIAGEGAVLGQPEILLGIIPGGGGTQRLARLVGPAKAKELIFSGAQLPATEALDIGWVDEVVPDDEVLARAIERASIYANGPRVAIRAAKRAIDGGLEGSLADGINLEYDLFVDLFDTDDATTGVASFFEHGPGRAEFTGT
ncbi:MAG: enoyl-CoA hydratase-related protein [Acidimicrobiales bacterium]|jgi:enoyl-CoA hydratase|nr:enoyl-CoA hydratase [Acidimicrobiaceae bacterium]MDP6077583.1 enoyl-CoA hydratase-related protein [Acidimicrobiales bacterium]MDP7258295.1 enoyl-CoA hydratase-related protein [Acidimicrobiales bacterium]HCV37085.1 enoyl-CoA hydratase [Acidimicrobiaceae bacterium]HJO80375.1 enoyl-CoA hydratase-related protein [Acidimicrobiales bacterium]|tara:strand:- start:806 stop:1618 length:813 start_codon:yes stop_codon:yes gene_type:complete